MGKGCGMGWGKDWGGLGGGGAWEDGGGWGRIRGERRGEDCESIEGRAMWMGGDGGEVGEDVER